MASEANASMVITTKTIARTITVRTIETEAITVRTIGIEIIVTRIITARTVATRTITVRVITVGTIAIKTVDMSRITDLRETKTATGVAAGAEAQFAIAVVMGKKIEGHFAMSGGTRRTRVVSVNHLTDANEHIVMRGHTKGASMASVSVNPLTDANGVIAKSSGTRRTGVVSASVNRSISARTNQWSSATKTSRRRLKSKHPRWSV